MEPSSNALPRLDLADLTDSARWLRGIATATQTLMTQTDLEQALRMALGCVGQAAQVEVVSVLQANDWGMSSSTMLESAAPVPGPGEQTGELSPERAKAKCSLVLSAQWSNNYNADTTSQRIHSGELGAIWHPLLLRWQKEWLAGRAVFGPIEHFPPEEQQLLLAQGVQSLVALPIHIQHPGGQPIFWGVLGLEAEQPLNWSLTEISTLCSVAACIGGAIARDAEHRHLQALNQALQSQVNVALLPAEHSEGSGTTGGEYIPSRISLPSAPPSQNLTDVITDQRRQAKQDFLTSLNQGLSAPLTGVLSQAQRLNRTVKLGAEEEQGLAMIHQHGSQLLQQIHWMLDLDRLRSNDLILHPDLVHFPAFLQGIVEAFRRDVEQTGQLLVYQPSCDLPLGVIVDVPRLQQVLMALLTSAKGEGQHGQITFSIRVLSHRITPRPKAARLKFSVTKTTQNLEDVTYRPVTPEQAGERGGDLAIAVSQQLLLLMGGELLPEPWVATSYHWGFELELPVQDDWHHQTLSHSQVVGYEGPRQRILVVDDRWENRGVLTSLLMSLGFEICEAVDGQDGLKQLASFKPDLVITDLVMPVLDGFAMMAEIRAQAEWEELPILVSSASVDLREQQRSLKQGGDDCLRKPIQLEELLGLLEKHLGLRWHYRDGDAALQ